MVDCEGTGVTTYCLHPGFVDSELGRDMNPCLVKLFACFWVCTCHGAKLSAQDGALTTLYCCLEPSIEQQTGLYYRCVRSQTV